MENVRVLILAAGKGTRMKSKSAKVLHQVGGSSLVEHVVRAARPLSTELFVVVGHQAGKVQALLSEAAFIDQKTQLGTGHAVMAARERFAGYRGDVLVLPGDVPLVRTRTLEELVGFHRKGQYAASILTAVVANPEGYGRIVRRSQPSAGPSAGEGEVQAIVEHRDAAPDILKIQEINSGIYVFDAPALFEALSKIGNVNAQSEYYLTDVIGILVSQGKKIGACTAAVADEILGVNTRQEMAAVDKLMRRRKCEQLMAEGVSIMDPDSTFIDADVQIGADTVVHPSVQIEGRAVIAEDVTVRSFSRITNSRIGARSTILEGCVIINSTIGEDVSVGPYAHLRTDVVLADGAKVGNFVEMKKSSLGKGSKSMHLAYVGDATVGDNVNIGAGVITVNYDGLAKHPTHIEDEAFIGSDSQLIAPIRVHKGAFVAAGSTITDDVPADGLAIARGRQVVKEGRAPHRKKRSGE